MKIVFVSNYYNHHQSALSEALFTLTNGQYYFIQTEEMEQERKNMGWGGAQLPAFVKLAYTSPQAHQFCLQLIYDADVVIAGGSYSVENYIQKRIKAGKLLMRYSERVYKNARTRKQLPLRAVKYHLCNFPYKNVYLLCASAYAAADYAKTGNFVNKSYSWGYFPATKRYENIAALIHQKKPASLLWVARLIDWKHPEICLYIAKRLKSDGYDFNLNIIGNGELENTLKNQLADAQLEDCVHLLGSMGPDQVRIYMEQSRIFLFTSDFNEGWGAVLNESMNSGCAVVASHAIGAAPYLIEDGVNGMLYKNGDLDDLYRKVKYLLDNPQVQSQMGECAYRTMTELWNAETVSKRLILLAESLLAGHKQPALFESGPCSNAPILSNDWYH